MTVCSRVISNSSNAYPVYCILKQLSLVAMFLSVPRRTRLMQTLFVVFLDLWSPVFIVLSVTRGMLQMSFVL